MKGNGKIRGERESQFTGDKKIHIVMERVGEFNSKYWKKRQIMVKFQQKTFRYVRQIIFK